MTKNPQLPNPDPDPKADKPKKVDIRSELLGELSWRPDERASSLHSLYAYVLATGEKATDWYFAAKRSKQQGAVFIRFLTIVIGMLAGLVPIAASIWTDEHGAPILPPAIASALLLVAAALVLLDRFFGFSDGWIRYVTTATTIRVALDDFRMQWELGRSEWAADKPSDEQTLATVASCRQMLNKINALVEQETREWAASFRDAIHEADKALEATRARVEESAAATVPGALNVVVKNGSDCADGWDLIIDARPERHCVGRSATANVAPGLHSVRVSGRIADRDRADERSVTVAAGQAVDVELELA